MTSSPTFDETIAVVQRLLGEHASSFGDVERLLVIRDLWGRIRIVCREPAPGAQAQRMEVFARALSQALGPHGFEGRRSLLFEEDLEAFVGRDSTLTLVVPGLPRVELLDRQLNALSWRDVDQPPGAHPPRIAFYSMKGGVGRSTAAAILAWHLARTGRRVLVVDLDLESPGLSTSLLARDRQPAYGVTDWLVEDLVGNGDRVKADMVGRSEVSDDAAGIVYVAPSHGREPGDYIAKLGRASLERHEAGPGAAEKWARRLHRLIETLESTHKPDVVLLDSRAGIHDIASAVVTDLDAEVLLFGIGSPQTWTGYEILFKHWLNYGTYSAIRERLQIVAALVPELERQAYLGHFKENAWNLFRETLYDELSPDDPGGFSFDLEDTEAPHHPVPIFWHRGIGALGSFRQLDPQQVDAAYKPFLNHIDALLEAMRK